MNHGESLDHLMTLSKVLLIVIEIIITKYCEILVIQLSLPYLKPYKKKYQSLKYTYTNLPDTWK